MNTVVVIQARVGSTRLPGKVLLPLEGKPVLARVIERVQAASGVDQIVVATTVSPQDDAIVRLCETLGVGCCRGSEDDVLDRYYQAALAVKADIVVRVTSDCPLFDPDLLSHMLAAFKAQPGLQFMTNAGYPRGLDVEIFDFATLARAWTEAKDPPEREHVTPYMYRVPGRFETAEYRAPQDLSAMRWTLDTEEDWDFIRRVYRALHREGEIFRRDAVFALLRRQPELSQINAHVRQKALGE